MKNLILSLPDIKFRNESQYGSKAVNLGVIARELKTPPGFCLSAEAYSISLAKAGISEKITSLAGTTKDKSIDEITSIAEEIQQLIQTISISQDLRDKIETAYQHLRQGRERFFVAVRSSATAEDLPSASFAGQMESFLNIASFSELIESIKKCWMSLWTPRAIHYRWQKGIGQGQIGMAVIVQEMVPAQVAGVMFTANPVTNSRNEIYIEAIRGLGEALVLGEANADRYIVLKEGLLVTKKTLMGDEPLLTDYHLKVLADAGLKLEFMCNEYQDIEWAYAQGEVFVLQTRPITTLADEEPEPYPVEKMTPIQRDIWVNVNERFPEPVLPMDGIVAKIYYLSLFSAYRELGFHVPYFSWHRVEQGLFPEFFIPPAIKPGISRLLHIRTTLNWDIEKEWKMNEAALNRYLILLKDERLRDFPLEIMMEYLEDALKDFQRALTFRYLLYIQYGTLYHGLGRLLSLLFGVEGRQLHEDLVVGHPQLTMELNEKLLDLAEKAKASRDVFKTINDKDILEIENTLGKSTDGKAFLVEFYAFIDKYGDRELSQGLGGVAVPTWREEPSIVWGMLKGMLQDKGPRPQMKIAERRAKAEKRLNFLMSQGVRRFLPLKGLIYKLVEAGRKYTAFRENSHYYLTQAMTVFRNLFLEVGKRLVKRDLLDEANDIMYFTYFELKEILYALYSCQKVSKLELTERVSTRRAQQERRRKRWLNRDVVIERGSEDVLQGIGASRGIITGPGKVITDPAELSRLRPGDILVAQYTNPAWTPVFAFIGGLVVEYGGSGSHAAIIAREYGIPAVMGVKDVTKIVQDGAYLVVDGTQGLVEIKGNYINTEE